MAVQCYSQRLLNPFRGVMNVIEMDAADAVTIDGVEWTLYVHDETDPWAHEDNRHEQITTPDIKYGTWSGVQGFRHGPTLSTMNHQRIEREGGRLLDEVRARHAQLPFAMQDHYELWLLDKARALPLVLLDSVCNEAEMGVDIMPCWIPGQRCKQTFTSKTSSLETKYLKPAEVVANLINDQAGDKPRAQWFWRDNDGKGFALHGIHLDDDHLSRQLSAEKFPALLLDTKWLASDRVELVYDFLAWQAPWLLLLQDLPADVRQQLEAEAGRQAVLTSSMYKLYPAIVDEFIFNRIRVEARLRQSEAENHPQGEEKLSAFYA